MAGRCARRLSSLCQFVKLAPQSRVQTARRHEQQRAPLGFSFVADEESRCPVTGKRKYSTEGEALSTAAHQIPTADAPKPRSYRCQWCDAWHSTQTPDKTRKGRG